jgi:hypothetical protein
MTITKVTLAGTGIFGAQIAFQTAFHGYAVMVYDISDAILEKSKTTFKKLGDSYKAYLSASQKQTDEQMDRLRFSSDLAKAEANADLVIEAGPKNPSIKKDFYKKLAAAAPEKTFSLVIVLQCCLASLPNQQVNQLNLRRCILPTRYENITQLKSWNILGRMRTCLATLLPLPNLSEWWRCN